MLKLFVSWLRWRARRSRKSTFLPAGVRTVIAVELTRLGDFVSILPPLRAIRKSFPAASVIVVTSKAHAPLLALCESGIDAITVDKPGSLAGFLFALRTVRKTRPDLVCSMGPSNRNAALALASGATFIVGYLNGTDSLTPFLGVTPVESIGFTGGGASRSRARTYRIVHGRSSSPSVSTRRVTRCSAFLDGSPNRTAWRASGHRGGTGSTSSSTRFPAGNTAPGPWRNFCRSRSKCSRNIHAMSCLYAARLNPECSGR